MPEACAHMHSGNIREEYCHVAGAERYGDAAVVLELMEELLYGEGTIQYDACSATSDSRRQLVSKEFSHCQGGDVYPTLPCWTDVSLFHARDKKMQSDHYAAIVEWQVGPERLSTSYFIDAFPRGRLLTCIESTDIINGGREERAMTPYDYAQLFGELSRLYEMQQPV